MSKNNGKKNITVVKTHRTANIIVSVVVGIAALILIAVAVLCAVRVDPLDKLDKPNTASQAERYDLYNLGSSAPMPTDDGAQSKIRNALAEMDFSVMNAILQWNWDYSYNFVRNESGDKINMTAEAIDGVSASSGEYMVEYVYSLANIVDGEVDLNSVHSLKVDGETVYFDRVKVLIPNTAGSVGEIRLYPYIYDRVKNRTANDGITYEQYKITPIRVRANTSRTYAELGEIVKSLNNGN